MQQRGEMHLTVLLAYGVVLVLSLPSSYHDCASIFEPQNYLKQLPSLSLPYLNSVPIPNNQIIKASPVITTKIINVVTKYVTTNPVCIKVTSKKPLCKSTKNNLDFLITKEYFVRDRSKVSAHFRQHRMLGNSTSAKNRTQSANSRKVFELDASEAPRAFVTNTRTPDLMDNKIREMLIEDRLDHLEDILPHYTRRRTYETSTVTITKTAVDNKIKATLLVKNCIPEGYEFCPPKRRRSRINEDVNSLKRNFTFNSNEFN